MYACMFWHSFWHLLWHSFWHLFWQSFWYICWYSTILFNSFIIFWQSIWHLFGHSLWHRHCWTSTASAKSQWAVPAEGSRLKFGSAHWDLELAVEDEEEKRRRGVIKSRDPHLAGGDNLRWGMVWINQEAWRYDPCHWPFKLSGNFLWWKAPCTLYEGNRGIHPIIGIDFS